MTAEEFSDQFDVLYNNITSNQAPGCNEYEKSVFLTKAQNEIVKNYFTPNSPGNVIQQGFDDSAKRQADFSCLMRTMSCTSPSLANTADQITFTITGQSPVTITANKIDRRSKVFAFPTDMFIAINEALTFQTGTGTNATFKDFQVIPLRFDEYTRLMSKPYKRPVKNHAWRLINSSTKSSETFTRFVEIITTPDYDDKTLTYTIRYIRFPKPIIVGNLDGLKIEGREFGTEGNKVSGCELDPILHQDILQRAVELAKVAWTATGQDNLQPMMEAGKRSE